MTTPDPLGALARSETPADSPRLRSVGAMSSGYRENDERREAAAQVEHTERGDTLRASADSVDARAGGPSTTSASLRLAGAYADRVEAAK